MPLPSAIRRHFQGPRSVSERERQAKVIRPVYWVGVSLTLSVGALQLLVLRQSPAQMMPVWVTLLAMLLGYPFIQRGHEHVAGILILYASAAINLYSMWTQGGVTASASRAYGVLVVAAGLALGPELVLPMALLAVGAFGIALFAQERGLIQGLVPLAEAQLQALTAAGLLATTAVVVYFAAKALQERASFNESVVTALPGVVHIFDLKKGHSRWLNRSMARQLGWDPAALPPNTGADLMHPEDQARQAELFGRWKRVADGEVLTTLFRMRTPQGQWRSFESRDTVYQRDEQGAVTEFIGYIEDVTQARQVEEGLQRAERLQALGQLAGGVAHDFNNVLAPILGHAVLIRQGLADDDERAQAADGIVKLVERARGLTRRMLGLGGADGAERHACDLQEVVAAFIPLLRRSLRHDLHIDLALGVEPLPVLADPAQVERVLLNLAMNAQDALPGQGRLKVALRREGAEAVIEFSDLGPGMSPEVRARAFEPFFTTKDPGQGTGLGLSSVHAILQQHGGRVELESAPGEGCRFTLHFPLQAPVPAAAAAPGTARPAWTGTCLLVDDEEDLRMVLKRMLQQLGWTVLEAGTGDAALAVAGRHDGPLDLLLTDIRLPGLRGPQICAALRAQRPGLRWVYMSGFNEESLDGPVLAKPFDLSQLRAALETARPR